ILIRSSIDFDGGVALLKIIRNQEAGRNIRFSGFLAGPGVRLYVVASQTTSAPPGKRFAC
ncbi:hypothetical protein ACS0Y6_13395, partial [Burkholderia gladioli]|uniref:hypothetical protein n=1 Tax=Burkholderia gladioli TaxID=28095 RepID=UPI003F79109C